MRLLRSALLFSSFLEGASRPLSSRELLPRPRIRDFERIVDVTKEEDTVCENLEAIRWWRFGNSELRMTEQPSARDPAARAPFHARAGHGGASRAARDSRLLQPLVTSAAILAVNRAMAVPSSRMGRATRQPAGHTQRTELRELVRKMKENILETALLEGLEENVDKLYLELDAVDTAVRDGQLQVDVRPLFSKVEASLLAFAKFSYSLYEMVVKMQEKIADLNRELDKVRMMATFSTWIKVFHIIVCVLLERDGVASGKSYLQLDLDLSKEGLAGPRAKWSRPVHTKLLKVLLQNADIAKFGICETDWEFSSVMRSEHNFTFHGKRPEGEELDGTNVKAHYDKDIVKLDSLDIPMDDKEAIERIMKCVLHVLQTLFSDDSSDA